MYSLVTDLNSLNFHCAATGNVRVVLVSQQQYISGSCKPGNGELQLLSLKKQSCDAALVILSFRAGEHKLTEIQEFHGQLARVCVRPFPGCQKAFKND